MGSDARRWAPLWVWTWASVAAASACTSNTSLDSAGLSEPSAASASTSTDPPPADAALALLTGGGAALADAQVQLIVPSNSAKAQSLQAFLGEWLPSVAFASQGNEYGLGTPGVTSPIESSWAWASPSYDTDVFVDNSEASTIEALLAASLDGNSAHAASANTVAVVVVPDGVVVSLSSDGADPCQQEILAWHATYLLPKSNVLLPYVVVPACAPLGQLDATDTASLALSGALLAALTNPYEDGYNRLSSAGAAWQLAQSAPSEVTSLCQLAMAGSPGIVARVGSGAWAVHRTWSNERVAAGDAPCAPADPNEAFSTLSAGELNTVAVSLDDGVTSTSASGVAVPAGGSVQVPLQVAASASLVGPIALAATALNTNDLSVSLSSYSAEPGQSVTLHCALGAAPKSRQYVVQLSSGNANAMFHQYLLVAQSP